MKYRRFVALLLLAAAIAPLAAAGEEKKPATPGPAPALLEAAALRADVAILRRAYETLHPGLYRYNTPAQMDSEFRALEQEFFRDRTLAEAYLALSIFAAKVKCGQTHANFYNQKKAVQRELFEAGRLPFYFRWLGERMIVTRSFADHPRLVPGAEVLAINGTPVGHILERLLSVARADGNNEAKRRSYLEVQGNDLFEAFDIFFPLFFPSPAAELTLRIGGPQGESEIRVPPQTAAARRELFAAAAATPDPNGPAWELTMLENHLAHLRMPTWALYDSSWDWKAFLATTFERLEKSGITDLVVDLRGNEGGVNSSATFEFAQTVRQNGLGMLVGQSTGGNQRGINGGAFFFLRLPNSGIELDLPLIGQFPAEQRPDAGLEPDILVTATPGDLAASRDVEMAAVRAAVAAGRPPG